ncbi:hypothetical protein RHMOL_Rhmol04G0219900 [Rhododendron molle]|uniref:Uncharacterized protein n=1 Tax=Rhododendron molle TaxID=49168 RepID=A0ACC0P5I5_RHOML|nr:hypothetical protein RHMOL_Rhmol04G0219900 [Rhododendron molle]
MSVDGGGPGSLTEGGDGEDRRTPMEVRHTPMGFETRDPRVSRLDSQAAVEGLVITKGGFGGASGAAWFSGHEPITKSDFAEYVGDDGLARLLEENPMVVVTVLATREERQRQIGLAEEEE